MYGWQVYMEEFRSRAERAQQQRFGRLATLTEAAHDAYQAATDRLTQEHGWPDERALVIMRGLNAGVQNWLEHGSVDITRLERDLERRERELADGFDSISGRG
jgi:hypothetical protein